MNSKHRGNRYLEHRAMALTLRAKPVPDNTKTIQGGSRCFVVAPEYADAAFLFNLRQIQNSQLPWAAYRCARRKERIEIISLLCSRLVLTLIDADSMMFSGNMTPLSTSALSMLIRIGVPVGQTIQRQFARSCQVSKGYFAKG